MLSGGTVRERLCEVCVRGAKSVTWGLTRFVFGRPQYFHKAPNPKELHDELVRKVAALNTYDCLRANKSTMAWGVEARVPFLDKGILFFSGHLLRDAW